MSGLDEMRIARERTVICQVYRARPAPDSHDHKGQYEKGAGVCISCLSIAVRETAEAVEQPVQVWFCEGCGVLAAFRYGRDDDAWKVSQRLGSEHQMVSPTCPVLPGELMALAPENVQNSEVLGRYRGTGP